MKLTPMLAAPSTSPEQVPLPTYASPKVDGFRSLNWGGAPLTRSLKPMPNNFVREMLSHDFFEGMDCELTVGEAHDPTVFQQTTSALRKRDSSPIFNVYAFDWRPPELDDRMPFDERHQVLCELLASEKVRNHYLNKEGRIIILEQRLITDLDELIAYEAENIIKGFEGTMCRAPKSPYKNGRSTLREGYLIKRKSLEDAEAEVIGFKELMINDNEIFIDERGYAKRSSRAEGLIPAGTLGSLICRELGSGVVFDLGSGFTDDQRADIWANGAAYLGEIVTFRHFPYGRKDAPRQPIFKGWRAREDMTDGGIF